MKEVLIDGYVYLAEYKDVYYDDILRANRNDDGTVDFEIKYYNGGMGFREAIEESLSS